MKKISLVLALVLSVIISTAQTWTKVNGRWQYQFLRTDSTFTPPQDTLASAPIGSIAVKNDVVYFKNVSGNWISLVGLSINLATANLTATGDYTHNWKSKQLIIDSVRQYYVFGRGQRFGRWQRMSVAFEPTATLMFLTAGAQRNAANTIDSMSFAIQGNNDGTLSLAGNNSAITGGASRIYIDPGSASARPRITITTDTIRAQLIPQGAGDSVVAIGPFDPLTKTNPLYKTKLNAGQNIANASLTANDDYVQDWNNKILRFDNAKSFNLASAGTFAGLSRTSAFTINPSASFPFYFYNATRNAANSADSIANAFDVISGITRMYANGLTTNRDAYVTASVDPTGDNHTVLLSASIFPTKLSTLNVRPQSIDIRAQDSAIVTAPGIRLYNTTGDIKLGTGPGVTPYATWKNAGALLVGTTTHNGFSKLQLNASLADFQYAQRIDITGSSTFANPIGLSISETSTDGGYGIQSFSTNGYGVAASGRYFGVAGTVSTNAEGISDAAGVVGSTFNNTTAPALLARVYGTNAAPNQILSGLDLWRTPTAFPTSAGVMMRTFLPVYVPAVGAVPGTPILANTITSATTNYNGPNYTTDMYFSGPKDSVYGRILTLKGGGQIQGDQYTGSNFETADTSFPALVVDATGKIFRRRGDGGGAGVTPTWDATMAAGANLSTTYNTTIANFQNWNISGNNDGLTEGLFKVTNSDGWGIKGTGLIGTAGESNQSGGAGIKGTATGATSSGVVGAVTSSGGQSFFGTASDGLIIRGIISSATTNTILPVSNYSRESASAGANGIGQSHLFSLKTSTTVDTAAMFTTQWTNATNGNQTSSAGWWVKNNGGSLFKTFNLLGTGQVVLPKYGINTFAGTAAYTLGVDASGNIVETATAPTITASNGLTRTGNDIRLGGTVNAATTLTMATGGDRVTFSGASNSSAFGVLQALDNGVGHSILALQQNASGKAGTFQNTASGGVALYSLSTGGVALSASENGVGVGASISSTSGIPVQTFSNLAGTTNVNTAIQILRSNPAAGGTPASGFGSGILFSHEDAAEAAAVDAGKIVSYWTSATAGADQSNLDFWTVSGATFDSKLSIKHNGKIQLNKYGINTFAGTPAYALGVDASGNVVEFAAGGSTPNIEAVSNAGSAFSTSHTFTTGTNVQTFSGANVSGQFAYAFTNAGNGGALSATSNGASNTTTFANSSSGLGAQISSATGTALDVSSTTSAATFTATPASTNTTQRVALFGRKTSGTAANNMGGSLDLQLQDAAGGFYIASQLNFIETDATAKTTSFSVNTVNAATSATRFTVKGSGQVQHNAYGSGTFTGTAATYPAYDASGNIIETLPKVKFVQTATVSVIANDNETTLIGAGTGSLTIPANTMAVGKNYRLTIRGTYGTDATNPAQQNWRVYLGGTLIVASGNAGLGTNRVDKVFVTQVDITCRTTGSSGTVMAVGMFNTEDGPGAKSFPPTTTTINTTTNLTLDFTTDLNDGSAGNNIKVYTLIFEEI